MGVGFQREVRSEWFLEKINYQVRYEIVFKYLSSLWTRQGGEIGLVKKIRVEETG